jgi:hypothetical protein
VNSSCAEDSYHPRRLIAAIKDAGYLHVPEGRRDHTTPAGTLRLHGHGPGVFVLCDPVFLMSV